MKLFAVSHWLTRMIFVVFISSAAISAQTTAFNYQGKLSVTGTPQPSYQMQFKLFGSIGGTDQIGNTITEFDVPVSDGVFSVKLDFGMDVFNGADRFLEIAVRPNANVSFLPLNPRQQIASSPYSIRTLSAAKADVALDANKLGGVAASEYVTNSTVGSSFIRNAAAPQQTANFNISGNGQIGGNLGIGTTAGAKLAVTSTTASSGNNTAYFEAPAIGPNASNIHYGTTGDWFIRSAASTGKVVLQDTGGFVGIGTGTPSSSFRLDVFGAVRSFGDTTHFVAQTTGGTNSWARYYMRSTNRSWFIGTSQNFIGDQFYLVDETGNQSRMTIQPNGGAIMFPFGNVGIGSVTPPTKFFVSDGNVGQSASNFGLPKAMLLIRGNGDNPATLEKCYNAVTGALSGNCGFTVSQTSGVAVISISFPFRVTDRFISMTPINSSSGYESTAQVVGFDQNDISGGTIRVTARLAGCSCVQDADFYLIVF